MDRQKILLILLVMIALGFGGDWAYRSWVEEPFQKQETEQTKLEKAESDVHDRMIRAKTLVRDLPDFEDRSLPANPVRARQAYQAWWWQLLKRYDIANPTVDVSQPRPRSLTKSTKKDAQADMHELGVTIRGVAELTVVIDLLAEFHQSNFLQRIDGLSLTPLNQGRSLSFTISASALALRTATELEKLPGQSTGDLILVDSGDPVASENSEEAGGAENLVSLPTAAAADRPATGPREGAAESIGESTTGAAITAAPATSPATTGDGPRGANAAVVGGGEGPVERPWQEIVKRNMFAAVA